MTAKNSKISNKELNKMLTNFQSTCRQQGLKITPQRMAIYQALLETDGHPSADVVFRSVRGVFPNISFDTVNRTLLTLNEIGAAFIVEGTGDAKRFDGNMNVHQHFRCVKCKKIINFRHKPFDKISIPRSVSKNFSVLRKTVYFEGLCNICST